MIRALLVVGAGTRFIQQARQMEAFLKDRGLSDVKLCLPAYFSAFRLEKTIAKFFHRASPEDVLLIGYFGHGNEKGWGYSSDGENLHFEFLAEVIKKIQNKVLVVNACCHSYALASLLSKGGVSLDRCGVIAAGHGRTSYDLNKALLSAWSKRVSYQPEDRAEKILVAFEFSRAPWRERLKEWWLRKYTEARNRLLPRRFPSVYCGCIRDLGTVRETIIESKTYEPSDSSNPFPVRWGAKLDPLFFGEG